MSTFLITLLHTANGVRFDVSTFTPQLQLAQPPRPITTDDLEKDRVLSQRIALFGWIEEQHLDIPEGEGSKGFLMFAQQGGSTSSHPSLSSDSSTRTPEDQPLQSSPRQANLHTELLQGHLRSVRRTVSRLRYLKSFLPHRPDQTLEERGRSRFFPAYSDLRRTQGQPRTPLIECRVSNLGSRVVKSPT